MPVLKSKQKFLAIIFHFDNMSQIFRLAELWRNKIFRFAKDGEGFQDLISEFDRPSFLLEPESGPQSMPASGPRSMRENMTGEILRNPQGMSTRIISQIQQEIETKFKELNEKLSLVIEPLKHHYDRKKAEISITDELRNILTELSEIESHFQAAIMDIFSSGESDRKNKLIDTSKRRLLEVEEKLFQIEESMYKTLKSNDFRIWSANEEFKSAIHNIYNLITKTKSSVGVLKGIISNEE